MTEPEIHNQADYVFAQAKYYKNFARVYVPNSPISRFDSKEKYKKGSGYNEELAETNLERSLRRSKSNIKDLTLCNKFDLFVTHTIAADRYNLDRSKQKLTSWIKNEKYRKGNFEYVIVPEFHKDKKALHFHGLFKDYKGELRQSFRKNGRPRTKNGRNVYTFPSYTNGLNNVQMIDNSVGSIARVGHYLLKYITKDMPILFGKNRYRASYGLKRPAVQDNPQPWYEAVEPDRKYENDFGTIIDFDYGKNALVDMFIEANRP